MRRVDTWERSQRFNSFVINYSSREDCNDAASRDLHAVPESCPTDELWGVTWRKYAQQKTVVLCRLETKRHRCSWTHKCGSKIGVRITVVGKTQWEPKANDSTGWTKLLTALALFFPSRFAFVVMHKQWCCQSQLGVSRCACVSFRSGWWLMLPVVWKWWV